MQEKELIDEKVNDDCTFVWKNKIHTEIHVDFYRGNERQMSLLGNFVSSLYLALYTSKK